MSDWPVLLWSPGDLKISAAATGGTGWLLCDGAAYSRTVQALLFNAIGTVYGNGDGSTTFNVPDYRGKTIIGAGTGPGLTARSRGQTGGEETHILTSGEMPSHQHAAPAGQEFAISGGDGSHSPGFAFSAFGLLYPYTDFAGGGQAHNNVQPYGVANVYVKT